MNAIEKFQLKQALTDELTKEAMKDIGTAAKGAGWGAFLGGPLGAAIGAGVGRKMGRGERYKGSPVARAAGGSALGGIPLAALGSVLARKGHIGPGIAAQLAGAIGGVIGAQMGAASAYVGKGTKVKKASPAAGAALGGALLGPLGAAGGAMMGKKKGETYKGSPALRAFGGATAGVLGGELLARKLAPGGRAELLAEQISASKGGTAPVRGALRGMMSFAKKNPGRFAAAVGIPVVASSLGGALAASTAKKKK